MSLSSGIAASFADAPAPVRAAAERAEHLYDTVDWYDVEVAAGSEPRLAWATDGERAAYTTLCVGRITDPAWPYARTDLFLPEVGATESPVSALTSTTIVGGRRPGHSSIVVDASGGDRLPLLDALMTTVVHDARALGRDSLLVTFADPQEVGDLGRSIGTPCLRLRSGRNWVLDLPGERFEDWLAGLDRKQRFNERATMRRLEDVQMTLGPAAPEDLDWIVPLELALYGRHANDYGEAAARQLHEAYLSVLGDRALTARAHHEGVPVGFASVVRHGDGAWVRQAGIAPGWENAQLYFGLVYHAVIRWAYASGVRSLDYSITADDVKRRRGATPRDRIALLAPLEQVALSLRPGYQPVFA